MGAFEWRGTVVYGSTGNEVPIPGRSNVFVLVTLEVSVEGAIGQVKAKRLV